MIFDGYPFAQAGSNETSNVKSRSIASFIAFLERKLGVSILFDARKAPYERPELLAPAQIADALSKAGIIRDVAPSVRPADEPRLYSWGAGIMGNIHARAGGSSFRSDKSALLAALAEALERYLWHEERDYFEEPVRATAQEIKRYGPYIAPERFAGFSDDERMHKKERRLSPDAQYLWIRGDSLVTQERVYLPAQTVSGVPSLREESVPHEPLIRERHTIGLATWPTKAGAQLAGILEILEREAFMVMWLNQFSLPRFPLSSLRQDSSFLAGLLDQCERYRFKVHAIQLMTDAPAHAICVVLEDESGVAPRFSLGLRSHRSLPEAVEKALSEALRLRSFVRRYEAEGKKWTKENRIEDMKHVERLYYWAVPENAQKLEFLVSGKVTPAKPAEWENDTEEAHLERILEWCRKSDFECVSVPLTASEKNPTEWHIEMMLMPDLQPTHLDESSRQSSGNRWKTMPEHFGLTPRNLPFFDAPHPFG